jgi:hypothetical protein
MLSAYRMDYIIMDIEDLFLESFEIKKHQYKKVNKKDILKIVREYDYNDEELRKKAIDWLNKVGRVFGWINGSYMVFCDTSQHGYDWHFLNLDYLDCIDILDNTNIDNHKVLNMVFNVIHNEFIETGKQSRHLLAAPDHRIFIFYKNVAIKIVEKYDLPYEVKEFQNKDQMVVFLAPIFNEGKIY